MKGKRMNANGPTVFIVEDDLSLCNALESLIESIGMPVRTHNSAQHFLNSYDANIPGCLLLDVRMPGMSGLNLLDALADNGAELPAVVMSAFADVPMAISALQKGAVHFI